VPADVWSFGVMLSELITRQKPFSSTFMTPVQVRRLLVWGGGATVGPRAPAWPCRALLFFSARAGPGPALLTRPCNTPHPPTHPPTHPPAPGPQIALAVSSNKLSPSVPSSFPAALVQLVAKCTSPEATARPNFQYIVSELHAAIAAVKKTVRRPHARGGGLGARPGVRRAQGPRPRPLVSLLTARRRPLCNPPPTRLLPPQESTTKKSSFNFKGLLNKAKADRSDYQI
jgi:hypothetical protein